MREGLIFLVMAVLAFSIYSNSLNGPFLFDDEASIPKNTTIRLEKLTLEGLGAAGLRNRPVAYMSFALNYYFHQYNVRGYHVVNILIHITTGILLYLFVKTTLNLLLGQKDNTIIPESLNPTFIAFFTALIWLVHPIQTQSVSYIVQRMNSMAAMFYIMSMLLYARARLAEEKRKKTALFAGCAVAALLALGSKPIAATLPVFIFLYEFYFFRNLDLSWLRRCFPLFACVLIILAVVAYIYLGDNPIERILGEYGRLDFTLTQRVLTELRVVLFYISLLIFPHPSRLNLEHDFALSHSLLEPATTLLSMGVIIALIGLAIYTAKKDRLLSFCILWFFGNLVIESSVIGLDIIFEHRTYLPSMLLILMIVTLAYRYIKPKWLRIAVLCGIALVCSVWTHERNYVWADSVTFWSDCVKKSPAKARPHSNLGRALAENGRPDQGIHHLNEALRIKPGYAVAHNNLGTALEQSGNLKEAVQHYSEAVRLVPGFVNAHYNLGVALHRQGKLREAAKYYSEALRVKPNHAMAHNNLGVVLQSQGKLGEAVSHYSEALRINPDYTEARSNLERAQRLTKKSSKGP
ncbi:MAG: tetratricopeptide repeat protein [Deltaproteobacteria bacterium]|nr:tetratricopeptide repeat protein [Deltaproteobacteria bacterium]